MKVGVCFLGCLLLAVVGGCAPGRSSGPPRSGPIRGVPDPAAGLQGGEFRLILGQEVRATVGTFPPFVGTVQMIRGSTLRLLTDRGEMPLRFTSIRVLEVRRYRRTRAVEVGLLGALAGGVLGRLTLVGLGGGHWKSQGRLLAPGLGAMAGGLVGALVGSGLSGDFWEAVPVPLTVVPYRR